MHYFLKSCLFLIFMLVVVNVGVLILVKMNEKEEQSRIPMPALIVRPTPAPIPPVPVKKEDPKPEVSLITSQQVKIIGRLSKGIIRAKTKNGWWECGVLYSDPQDIGRKATELAYHIVTVAAEVSEKNGNRGEWELNPWAFAALIYNESGMDKCALGTHPRNWAYQNGLIERNHLTISHTKEEVLKALTNPKMKEAFKDTGVDIGLTQLLSRFYPEPDDYSAMMTLEGGLSRPAWELEKRHRIYKTDRPWRWWRGSEVGWYDEKVVRWARYLGAKAKDLAPFIPLDKPDLH